MDMDESGGTIRLSFEGRELAARPGQTVRIGRNPDNELVTDVPTVSRQHAVLRHGPGGWEFENTGSAPTYVNGQQVTQVTVDRPLSLVLGSADGPVLRAEPVAPAAPVAPVAPAAAPVAAAPAAVSPAAGAAPASPSPWTAGYQSTAFAQSGGYPAPACEPLPAGQPLPAGYPPPAGYQQAGYPAAGQAGYEQAGYQQAGYQQAGDQQPPAGAPGWGAMPGPAMPPGGSTGDDMATALRILFPIHGWLHDKGWRQGLRLLVIAYALLPLIFLATLSSSTRLSTPGWAYSLYVAPLWIMGFWMLIRPGRVGKQEIWAAAGIVVWTLAWMNVVTIHVNDALHIKGTIGFLPALIIGFNEEITKALPVLLAGLILLRYRKVKLSVRMCMFLGTIAGLTFGVFEQAFYTSKRHHRHQPGAVGERSGQRRARLRRADLRRRLPARRLGRDRGLLHRHGAELLAAPRPAHPARRCHGGHLARAQRLPRRLLDLAGHRGAGGVAAAVPRVHDVGGVH